MAVPVWAETTDLKVVPGQLLQFLVSANDPDGDKLTYNVGGLPAGAVFDPDNQFFSWTPRPEQQGVYPLVFRASDGVNVSDMVVNIVVGQPLAVQQQAIPLAGAGPASTAASQVAALPYTLGQTSNSLKMLTIDNAFHFLILLVLVLLLFRKSS